MPSTSDELPLAETHFCDGEARIAIFPKRDAPDQDGTNDAGQPIRWTFTVRQPDSFHWMGERLLSQNHWKRESEFFARRVSPGIGFVSPVG